MVKMVLQAKVLMRSLQIRGLKIRSQRRINWGTNSKYLARLKKRRRERRKRRKEPFTTKRNTERS